MEVRLTKNRIAILEDLEPKKHWNYLTQERVLDYNDLDELEVEKQEKPELNFFRVTESLLSSPLYEIYK